MAIRIHQVKISPPYFVAVVNGTKKAELRKNDRGYQVGDVLSLVEWKHGESTGREWAAAITHILPVKDVMAEGGEWVMLSIQSLAPLDALSYVIAGGVL